MITESCIYVSQTAKLFESNLSEKPSNKIPTGTHVLYWIQVRYHSGDLVELPRGIPMT